MSCRLIYKLDKYDNVTKHKKPFQWKLYPERINYKIVLLMFKCKNNMAAACLTELVHFHKTVTVTNITDHSTKTLQH